MRYLNLERQLGEYYAQLEDSEELRDLELNLDLSELSMSVDIDDGILEDSSVMVALEATKLHEHIIYITLDRRRKKFIFKDAKEALDSFYKIILFLAKNHRKIIYNYHKKFIKMLDDKLKDKVKYEFSNDRIEFVKPGAAIILAKFYYRIDIERFVSVDDFLAHIAVDGFYSITFDIINSELINYKQSHLIGEYDTRTFDGICDYILNV